ncbi:hypothetical protein FACS1894125_7480 [Actinomycetota bacterium]|nr:hypothetical protein FACS1894125_7480 [Actinomycetota bacterium]
MLRVKGCIKQLKVGQKVSLMVTLILMLLAIIFVPSVISFNRLKAQDERAQNSKEMTLDELTDFLSEEFPKIFKGCLEPSRGDNNYCGIFNPYIAGTDDGIYDIRVFDYGNFATDEYLWSEQFRRFHSGGVNEEKTIVFFGYNWRIIGVPDAIYAIAEKLDGCKITIIKNPNIVYTIVSTCNIRVKDTTVIIIAT